MLLLFFVVKLRRRAEQDSEPLVFAAAAAGMKRLPHSRARESDHRTERLPARDPASLTQMQPALNLNPAPLTQMRCSPPYRGHACRDNCSDHATIHEHENTCTPAREKRMRRLLQHTPFTQFHRARAKVHALDAHFRRTLNVCMLQNELIKFVVSQTCSVSFLLNLVKG